jgi:hypothetical protein
VAVLKLINGGGGGSEPEPEPPEDEIATDEEVDEVLDEVFGDDDITEVSTVGGTDTSGD